MKEFGAAVEPIEHVLERVVQPAPCTGAAARLTEADRLREQAADDAMQKELERVWREYFQAPPILTGARIAEQGFWLKEERDVQS